MWNRLWAGVAAGALFMVCSHAYGQPVAKPLAEKPAADPACPEIARWVDARVVGYLTIDVEHFDVGAMVQQVADAAAHAEPAPGVGKKDLTKLRDDMVEFRTKADAWRHEFVAAGGHQAWLLVGPRPVVIVPLSTDADVEKLSALLTELDIGTSKKVTHRDGALIVGDPLRGLPAEEPSRAAELKAAGQAVADITPGVVLMMVPTDDHRVLLGPVLTMAGKQTGVTVPADLNMRVLWAGLGVASPPTSDIRLVIKGADQQAARQVAAMGNELIEATTKVQEDRPLLDAIGVLKFIANEDQAELRISASAVKRIVGQVVPPMVKARRAARQTVAMSQARMVAMAVQTYAADTNDTMPAKIDDLKNYLQPTALKHPDGKEWVYVGHGAKLTDYTLPAESILLHEGYKTWPEEGVMAAFVDGHVELVTDEKRFLEMVKR